MDLTDAKLAEIESLANRFAKPPHPPAHGPYLAEVSLALVAEVRALRARVGELEAAKART